MQNTKRNIICQGGQGGSEAEHKHRTNTPIVSGYPPPPLAFWGVAARANLLVGSEVREGICLLFFFFSFLILASFFTVHFEKGASITWKEGGTKHTTA